MHVGNDIVDLTSPYVKGKSSETKFVQRVLTSYERQALLKYDNPDNLLQVFWAAKETAYKVSFKLCPQVTSAPRRYDVCLDTPKRGRDVWGRVKTPLGFVHITARLNPDFIHCFGTENLLARKTIICGVEPIDGLSQPDFCRCSETLSRMVRASAIKEIASNLSLSENDISITKVDQKKGRFFPEVYIKGEKAGITISLSHDGRFIAYAFLIQRGPLL
jgi:phosphopantetheinyl transferase (holo-ACP synthase)